MPKRIGSQLIARMAIAKAIKVKDLKKQSLAELIALLKLIESSQAKIVEKVASTDATIQKLYALTDSSSLAQLIPDEVDLIAIQTSVEIMIDNIKELDT